jgi:predicted amidophosphoribosyltransferase
MRIDSLFSQNRFSPKSIARYFIGLQTKRTDANVPLFADFRVPLPFICPGCNESHWIGVCHECLEQIKRCDRAFPSPVEGIEAIAPLFFSFSPAHALLTHWKDHGGTHLEQRLFQIHPDLKIELQAIDFDFVIGVPQSLKRNWDRGHSSSLKTAEYFSKILGKPIRHTLELREKSPQHKQASLDQWGRRFGGPLSTPGNPFEFTEPFSTMDRNVLLVDDLITSGSTLLKAADAIRAKIPRARIWAACLGYRPKRALA